MSSGGKSVKKLCPQKHIKKEGVLLYFGAYLPIIIDCKQDGMITPNRISSNDMISY